MAAQPSLIPIEEYLRMTSEPDCEYVAGVIEERAVGELDHASWQKALLRWFFGKEADWEIRVYPELRVQTASDRFRVPDVVILSRTSPREQIVTLPPLAVFEILSPEDSMARTLEKLSDYERMGIPAIWLIEPKKQVYYCFEAGQLIPGGVFSLPGTSFTAPFAEIAALAE